MAIELGCSTSSLSRALARWALRAQRSGRRKLSDARERELCARYASGESTRVLAQEFGLASMTVTKIARRHGKHVHPRGGRFQVAPAQMQQIQDLWEKGLSQGRIALRLGVHQSSVSRVLRHAGIDTGRTRISRGEQHGSWKGGRAIHPDGYVLIRLEHDDPLYAVMAKRSGYVLEHRLVMARSLGRPLTERETVHHINGDRQDNRLENLQLRKGKHGNGVVLVCADCGSHNVVTRPLTEA